MAKLVYSRTRRALEHIGDRTVSKVKQELINSNINASNQTYKSIRYDLFESGDIIGFGISSRKKDGIQILEIIDKGRKAGKAPPVQAIEQWIKDKNIQTRGSKRDIAFLIARKIGWMGIPPKNVFDKALSSYKPVVEQQLLDALGADLDQFIDENMPSKT